MSTFLGQSLKSSRGGEDWLGFFELIGSGLAMVEGDRRQRPGRSGDTVLVASDSLESLRRAFPNYFLDTRTFVAEMDRLLA